MPFEGAGEPRRPHVVDFEEPDGSGRTKVLRGFAARLRRAGYRVVTYETPGSSPTGKFAASYGNRKSNAPVSRMLLFLVNTVEEKRTMKRRCARIEADFLCSEGITADVDVSDLVGLFEALSGDHLIRPDLYVVIRGGKRG